METIQECLRRLLEKRYGVDYWRRLRSQSSPPKSEPPRKAADGRSKIQKR